MNGIQRQLKQKSFVWPRFNKQSHRTDARRHVCKQTEQTFVQAVAWGMGINQSPATNAGSRNSRPFIVLYEFLVCLFLFVFVSVALFTCYLFPSNRRRYAVFSPLKKGYIGKEKDRKANIFEIISPNI